MKLAVLSDIHGNLEALEKVLADADAAGVEDIVSLGDNIGYGPDPNQVLEMLRARGIPSVMGNHELAVVQPKYLSWFNPVARKSIEMTASWLSGENLAHIRGFPTHLVRCNAWFVHGYPPNSPLVYLFTVSERRLRQTLTDLAEAVCFTGHTHSLEIVWLADGQVHRKGLARGTADLNHDARYILNVGSVGQPRDGNHDAKYAIWDSEARTLEIRFVPYDIESTVAKILRAGLPEVHANRLR